MIITVIFQSKKCCVVFSCVLNSRTPLVFSGLFFVDHDDDYEWFLWYG